MSAFLFSQGFKGEPGEDGLVVSIAQQRPCARPPRFRSPFSTLQQRVLCQRLWENPWEIVGALKRMFVQRYLCQ